MKSARLKWFSQENDSKSSSNQRLDNDSIGLSYVGEAVHDVLRKSHNAQHRRTWNVTSGKVVGSIHQTPRGAWKNAFDPDENHDDWFPEKMAEIIGRTKAWCDVMSLGPPDGKFMIHFKKALANIAERSKNVDNPIIVRMMFGNIVGMPVNCDGVIKHLTKDLPKNAKLHLWVGAWRKGFSWNHAKLIAIDGIFLHTGGHNLWDSHYLSVNPVHDMSIELEGRIACDGHRFANEQWHFIKKKQLTCTGCFVDMLPDYLPVALRTRVTVSEYPIGVASIFPPQYSHSKVFYTSHHPKLSNRTKHIPLISIGRQGTLLFRKRPSDDAILAMINSSKRVLRFVLQDLGPVCIPRTKRALPGLTWPKDYLAAMGQAIYERGVDIEMILSNPYSVPGGLKGTEANYGNGWDCVDVTAEIVKAIQKQFSEVEDARLREMVTENLRICFTRHAKKSTYEDGTSIGMHSKHFIVDDKCCYIGSQNLYLCDLAEWGVIVDNEDEVRNIMNNYFVPLWENSFTDGDVDVQKVMDGLNIDRDGDQKIFNGFQTAEDAQHMMPHGTWNDCYNISNDVEGNVVEKATIAK